MPRSPEDLQGWRPDPPTPREIEAAAHIDQADLEVYRRKLELACYEARELMMRMGVSPMIQGGDLCVGIYTPGGNLAAAVMGTHLHLINCQMAIKYTLKYYKDDETVGIRPGDMFYVNDTWYGGIHSPDQILYMPIFHNGELVAWCGAMSHETETGAIEPGGNPPSAKTRYDEGMRLAPFKVGENYKLKSDLVEVMENFVRDPRMQTLDLKARAAACFVVEKRVREVLERKGPDFLIGLMRKLIDLGEQAARARIRNLNDGIYRQAVFLDTVGAGKYGLLRAMVSVKKKGDQITIDFSGSSPRVIGGNFNVVPHVMIAETACFIYQFLFPDLNPSIGVFAPFEFVFEKGSFFDPDFEDATSLGMMTVQNVNPAIHLAFQRMLMDSDFRNNIVGPWCGCDNSIVFAGANQYGDPYAAFDQGIANGCGMGAKHDGDGTDVAGFVSCPVGEFLDTEQVEMQYPLLALFRTKYLMNAHGFGKYRGGRTIGMLYAFHNTPMGFTVPVAGHAKFPVAQGLFGGYAQSPSVAAFIRKPNWKALAEMNPDELPNDVEELQKKIQGEWLITHTNGSMQQLAEGDLFFSASFGGPGYGDVLERDPQLVMKDLREESISHWVAQNVYKVVYDPETLIPDLEATERLRAEERENRKKRGRTWDEFQTEWSQKKPKDELLTYFGTWPDAKPVPQLA